MHRRHTYRTAAIAAFTALVLVVDVRPLAADEPPPGGEANEVGRTPPRLSFLDGEVSFWRPGAEDWAPAQINIPLAPGDQVYTGPAANMELQIGPRAFVRAGAETQLGLDNQELEFLQFRMTTGHASVDIRSMTAGRTIEVDTPNAAFTIDRTGYYRVDIDQSTTTFITRRGGRATMIPAGGEAVGIAPSEEVVVQGTENPNIGTYAAPEIDAWDGWNYARTDHLIDPVSARYLSPGMYGADALDHYGDWRVVDPYGPVWVPDEVASDWAPYSTGSWVWDPFYGWTWVDEAPWGWAPYHYGRWVHIGRFWGWAPGPLGVAPVYAPALVAFFGGSHWGISFGGPAVGWVALSWGEPCLPWWGHPGFVGRPWWGGWGGPRMINNVVVERATVVNITNITYRNAQVPDAVIAAREDRFGRGHPEHVRLREADLQRLEPVRGPLPVKPVSASLVPTSGHAFKPPAAVLERRVVATHAPHDVAADLRPHGLNASPAVSLPAPRVVTVPRGPGGAVTAPGRAPAGREGTVERTAPAPPPRFGAPQQPAGQPPERRAPAARVPEQRAPAGTAPSIQAPAPRLPESRAPGAPPQAQRGGPPPGRELPGQPANRLYRSAPQPAAPHAQAPPPAHAPQSRHEAPRPGGEAKQPPGR